MFITEFAEQEEKRYRKTYGTQFRDLEKAPLGRAISLQPHHFTALGEMLERFDRYKSICEATNSIGLLGTLPKVALDVITAVYGASPLATFCLTQQVKEQVSLVYFRDWIAQNTRGNVTAGQRIINAIGAPDVSPLNFARDAAYNVTFINDTTSGSTGYTNQSLAASGQQIQSPIDPQRIQITGSATFTESSVAYPVNFPTMYPNPETGIFSGAGLANTTQVSVYGTVNYTNGTVTIAFSQSTKASSTTTFTANYATLLEDATDVPRVQLQMTNTLINVDFYTVATTWGDIEEFVYSERFGGSLVNDNTRDLMTTLNLELCDQGLSLLSTNCPASTGGPSGSAIVWKRQAQSGVSAIEHQQSLTYAVNDLNKQLYNQARRGTIKTLVCGMDAATTIQGMPGFTLLFDNNSFGPHIFGTWMGYTIVRVPDVNVWAADLIIGVATEGSLSAPVVYAPFMPIYMTGTLKTFDNPLLNQKAITTGCGFASIIPNMSSQMTIDLTGYNYGAAA